MLNFLQPKFVNGVSGDPAVYGFCPKSGDALLFDLGSLKKLPAKMRLKVKTVLVSHTHVDHFIGFDELLRVNIPHRRTVDIVGPANITQNVFGKLSGYTWNLLEPGQITFRVTEYTDDQKVRVSVLKNENQFRPIIESEQKSADSALIHMLTTTDGLSVQGIPLDHGCVSMAYKVTAPTGFPVNLENVLALGLKPGPWIRTLQAACSKGESPEFIDVDGHPYTFRDLSQQVLGTPVSESVAYITDVVFSLSACEALRRGFVNPTLLICESSYSEEDRSRAFKKKHLTAKQAALFAASCGANELRCFHVSRIYAGREEEILQEAGTHFHHFRTLPWPTIREHIIEETRLQQKS